MENILTLSHITKLYPGVVALDDVTLELREGEVHALMGENGAGKSTLMKVLSGAIHPDGGEIIFEGKAYPYMNPQLAHSLGIEIIYQEFNLLPTLSVAENVFSGRLPGNSLIVNKKVMEEKTKQVFETMGVDIDPKEIISNLTVANMQLVEIAKAVVRNTKILIMDEPTAPLTLNEVEILFKLIRCLNKKGVTIVYISHRMNEIFELAERITVMRDGKKICCRLTKNTTEAELIHDMVGRDLTTTFPQRKNRTGDVVLEVDGLSGNGDENISFQLYRGEILGLAGLVGAGRTELARLIFGADPIEKGTIRLEGKEIHPKSPEEAVKAGIALVPEDRKQHGVVLGLPLYENIVLPSLKDICRLGVLSSRKEKVMVDEQIDSLKIKTPSSKQLVKNLSGGNQQKVVLAKWMARKVKILIFDEPTRGIDVGAKQEIYHIMNELVEQGISIIMISSEMEEIIGMSDRILVLAEGRQKGILKKEEISQEKILMLASGIG